MASTQNNNNHGSFGFNLDRALERIAERARGCDAATKTYSLAYIICLANGKKFQNGEYCPNPSDSYCRYYDMVNAAMSEVWDRFVSAGKDEFLWVDIDEIQSSGTTTAEYRKALNKLIEDLNDGPNGLFMEPKEIRQVALGLLDYDGGSVYNPFAGIASYGEDLRIGNNYYGEEINRELWGLGMISLILKGCPSDNYVNRLSPGAMLDTRKGESHQLYDRAICSVPFGLKIPDENGESCPVEEILLSGIDQYLAPTGKMVLVVPSTFLNRGRRTMEIRREICRKGLLDSVIVLPKKIFDPYTKLQTAIVVLSQDAQRKTIKLIDASSCTTSRNKLDVKSFRSQIENKNYITEVTQEALMQNSYSWHFAKYEDDVPNDLEPGHSKKQLRSFMIYTGRDDLFSGQVKRLTVSDLSSNPFSFIKSLDDIPVFDASASEKVRGGGVFEDEVIIAKYDKELQTLQDRYSDLQREIQHQQKLADDAWGKNLKDIGLHRNAIESEIHSTIAELDDVKAQLDKLFSPVPGKLVSIRKEEIRSLETRAEALQHKLEDLKKEHAKLSKLVHTEFSEDLKIKARMTDLANIAERIKDVEERKARTQEALASIDGSRNSGSTLLRQVVHPSLIIGGSKPKVKFAYVDASPSLPVYLSQANCFAFKVDQAQIDLGYLVYLISTIEFKDFGERFKSITANDILNRYVDVIDDIDEQKAFVHERELEVDPIKRDMENLRIQYEEKNAKFDSAIGYKRHEMGHYMYQIGNSFNRIYRIIRQEKDFLMKDEIYRQMYMIEDSMKGINGMIDRLGERETFGSGTPMDIKKYLTDYVSYAHPDGYSIELIIDKNSIDEDMDIICSVNQDALDSAIHCIRQNAWSHGFQDDKTRDDYKLVIVLSYDSDSDKVLIDFINNGTPMDKGVDYDLYSSPEGKTGKHANTGKGGAFVCEMAKTYGGECQINPDDAYRMYKPQTVIRIILPYDHE